MYYMYFLIDADYLATLNIKLISNVYLLKRHFLFRKCLIVHDNIVSLSFYI